MSPFLQKALPLVELLVSVEFPGAATILNDIIALGQGISTKDPAVITTAAATLLDDAKTQNLISGQLVDEAANELGQIAAFVADVKANQVSIIRGNTSLFGVKGVFAFIPSASEQGQSLGL